MKTKIAVFGGEMEFDTMFGVLGTTHSLLMTRRYCYWRGRDYLLANKESGVASFLYDGVYPSVISYKASIAVVVDNLAEFYRHRLPFGLGLY